MSTKESIAEEFVAEAFAKDTSPVGTLDTRTLLVRTGANVIAAIESLEVVDDETEIVIGNDEEANCYE